MKRNEMKNESLKQFFSTKVKRKVAGYKSNYKKHINNARSASERKALQDAMDRWIDKKRRDIITSLVLELSTAIDYLEQSK